MTRLSLKEWKQAATDGVEVQLPSGLVVQMRPVSVATFVNAGFIPDNLTPVVARMLDGLADGSLGTKPMEPAERIDDLRQQDELMSAFIKTCIVWPKVVDDGHAVGEDEVTPAMFSDEDKIFIFAHIGRPALDLMKFRPQQENALDSLVSQPVSPKSAE